MDEISRTGSRELVLTCLSIAITAAAFLLAVLDYSGLIHNPDSALKAHPIELGIFFVLVAFLLYGSFVYQFARAGSIRRQMRHIPRQRRELDEIYDRPAPRLSILIPTYNEEERVLRQTVFSAALVEYPERKLTVLIDDPPSDFARLMATRKVVEEVRLVFEAERRRLKGEYLDFLGRAQSAIPDVARESEYLAGLYKSVADWLEDQAREFRRSSTEGFAHVDALFAERILFAPAAEHRARAAELREGGSSTIEREYRRLAALFDVDIASFERKQYANLSHRPNKAMNLNAYIGLTGRSFRERDGLVEECAPEMADFSVPSADYLLTLDADSVIACDYALRLIDIMDRQPALAVAQTPYSAFPGAPTLLERAAGATTDLQYVIHQGFTWADATYWVGANAVLRFGALEDIRQTETERGYRVPIFIQDRTVIEDTGSTIDLIRRGWSLFNYPERLAFSATPSDFGALIIQRRRWSNGGLIILPDLLRHCVASETRRAGLGEAIVRAHYLCSPALANFALLVLLLFPFSAALGNVWLPLTAAPYFIVYGRDLRRAGYQWADLLRVYALNLLLLPVNLAGVIRSLRQAVTGKKSSFGRTPKIDGRTRTPPSYVLFHLGLLALLAIGGAFDIAAARYAHAIFALGNAGFLLYGFSAFIGWRNALSDLKAAWLRRRRLPAAAPLAGAGVLSALKTEPPSNDDLAEYRRPKLPAE